MDAVVQIYILSFAAALFNIIIVAICVFIGVKLMSAIQETLNTARDCVEACGSVSGKIQPTAWYPIYASVIATLYRITPKEVAHEYARDSEARGWIVRHTFPPNGLTTKFGKESQSRFISHGYNMSCPPVVPLMPKSMIDIKKVAADNEKEGSKEKEKH